MPGEGNSCHWSMGTPNIYGSNAISNKFVFKKVAIVSNDFGVMGSWFQIFGTTIELGLGIKNYKSKNQDNQNK